MEYRRNTLQERRGKLHSRILWISSAIDALLYSFQNMNTVREELHLSDDQFRMILEVHKEYHQLIEDKVKQVEDKVWFDKLDQNVCTFKQMVHNWFKKVEESLERKSKRSSFGKKAHSGRSSSKSGWSQSSNSSTKERAIAERIQIAELKAGASFVERKHATEYEAEPLRIQEQMTKAEARSKVFEMMDQQTTKSEADLIKRKNSTIQSRTIERDIWDDLLYQQHQQHLNHPRTQLLN